jgi:hypothetical protein
MLVVADQVAVDSTIIQPDALRGRVSAVACLHQHVNSWAGGLVAAMTSATFAVVSGDRVARRLRNRRDQLLSSAVIGSTADARIYLRVRRHTAERRS